MTTKEKLELLGRIEKAAKISLAEIKNDVALQEEKFVTAPRGWEGKMQTRYHCPTCHKRVSHKYQWCIKCGQKIKLPKVVEGKYGKVTLVFED